MTEGEIDVRDEPKFLGQGEGGDGTPEAGWASLALLERKAPGGDAVESLQDGRRKEKLSLLIFGWKFLPCKQSHTSGAFSEQKEIVTIDRGNRNGNTGTKKFGGLLCIRCTLVG